MPNTLSSLFKPLSRVAPLLFLFFFSLSCTSHFELLPPTSPVLNPLNDWLYRGPQPTKGDFAQFKEKGIRTVVDFREEADWIEREKREVESLGMNYVSLPWNIMKPVKPELLDRFFEVLDEPKNRPVFFHCKHGRDRSGVMATLALMRYEGLSEKEAREWALGTIHPHPHYRPFVNQKIDFFLKERASEFSHSSAA